MALLRDGLLHDRAVVLAGGGAAPIADALAGLGARLEVLPGPAALTDSGVPAGQWAREHAPLTAVVFDSRQAFGDGGHGGLAAALEQAWMAVLEVASGALIPRKGPGKVVLIGPRPNAGAMAEPARAGLANLARTLSVEWARYQITTTMIAPGAATDDGVMAQVVAFVCSPGGEYLSGCRLELGAVA